MSNSQERNRQRSEGGSATLGFAARHLDLPPYHPIVRHLVYLLRDADTIAYTLIVNDKWDLEYHPSYGRVIDLLLDANLIFHDRRLTDPEIQIAGQIEAAVSRIQSETDESFALIWAFPEDRVPRFDYARYRDRRNAVSALAAAVQFAVNDCIADWIHAYADTPPGV